MASVRGWQVGLLDIDICGPSLPKMLGLEGQEIHSSGTGWSPVYLDDNLGVMSIGFMLPNPDDAVIWRGPRKNGLIKQFLKARRTTPRFPLVPPTLGCSSHACSALISPQSMFNWGGWPSPAKVDGGWGW